MSQGKRPECDHCSTFVPKGHPCLVKGNKEKKKKEKKKGKKEGDNRE